MPPPSQLAIATSALTRLVKEKASYHKEHAHQEANIAKLESAAATSEDENAEYTLRQEVCVSLFFTYTTFKHVENEVVLCTSWVFIQLSLSYTEFASFVQLVLLNRVWSAHDPFVSVLS